MGRRSIDDLIQSLHVQDDIADGAVDDGGGGGGGSGSGGGLSPRVRELNPSLGDIVGRSRSSLRPVTSGKSATAAASVACGGSGALSPRQREALLQGGGEWGAAQGAGGGSGSGSGRELRPPSALGCCAPASLPGCAEEEGNGAGGTESGEAADSQHSSGEARAARKLQPMSSKPARVREWVATKGAFYQNSVGASAKIDDDDSDADGGGGDGYGGGGGGVADPASAAPQLGQHAATAASDGRSHTALGHSAQMAPPLAVADDGGRGGGGPTGNGRRAAGGVALKGAISAHSALTLRAGSPTGGQRQGRGTGTGFGFGSVASACGDPRAAHPAAGSLTLDPAADDGAASEAGYTAVSGASSADGSEYKRGKRFRKLAKIMDSSQAKQVQQRFRTHALLTVALLAVVHVVCFAMVVTSIAKQRRSMLLLASGGETQWFMHEVMTDVRTLDVVTRGHGLPNLYTEADIPNLLLEIEQHAEEIKVRFNDILTAHSEHGSPIKDMLFNTKYQVWDTETRDGTNVYMNVTVWDFVTRFFTMAKAVHQQYGSWRAVGLPVNESSPGHFLLHSGPDLFRVSRKVFDALLYDAVADSRAVDTMQLVFLVVEGACVSAAAACYLAYLLRSVAAQRHKLFRIFIAIPVDEDEDDDDEEGEHARASTAEAAHGGRDGGDGGGGGGGARADLKKRRPSFLIRIPGADGDDGGGADDGGVVTAASTAYDGCDKYDAGLKLPTGQQHNVGPRRRPVSGTASRFVPGAESGALVSSRSFVDGRRGPGGGGAGGGGGCLAALRLRLMRLVSRSGRGVNPLLPQASMGGALGAAAGAGAGAGVASSHAASGGGPGPSRRTLRPSSKDTAVMTVPFVVWSLMVIILYTVAVVAMRGVVNVVAVHSVTNFVSARAARAVFYAQELANTDDPSELPTRRAALAAAIKLIKDAWYTVQLGDDAYKSAGSGIEMFPLVREGVSFASGELTDLFYGNDRCHRTEVHLPCPGPDYRFYHLTRTGVDSIMQQFIISLNTMASDTGGLAEGLMDEHFDFVYNVGSKDLLDGTLRICQAHSRTILDVFQGILIFHIVLFLLLFANFAVFLFLMLNPLLSRVTKERRQIAELMSQLPLELDVERLVERALAADGDGGGGVPQPGGGGAATAASTTAAAAAAAAIGERSFCADGGSPGAGGEPEEGADTASKWRAIIR
ncbi:hypothetical protein GPECTOR_16g570 [Gonium pectorale]|uniref:Uncharacterized protein n=1 Tax=Gonium pectorale TaxID=33097 RepID=A0A150GKT2_GONPE|nr:hypothetical protein GPECTOR_16g570 [Gonium pectorale]|eukprot:KXZ50397.1 hypothetical protein GPECTOR_16g570 [Gonium pectorale]